MKRVLILNGDSYVGERVARRFYGSGEYEVEVSLGAAPVVDVDGSLCESRRTPAEQNAAQGQSGRSSPSPRSRLRPLRAAPPSRLRPYVTATIPGYTTAPLDFCACVLQNDVIIAILEDDASEAECAVRTLMNAHYEVEKTFVLVSSCLTWANTLIAERAVARAARRRERAEGRRATWESALADAEADEGEGSAEVAALRAKLANPAAFERDEELPPELREPVEDVTGEELVPSRVFTESEYAARVPHPRYQHWKTLEHVVKRANSATLHTYVIFAGLPYGSGEGCLYDLFRGTQRHTSSSAALSHLPPPLWSASPLAAVLAAEPAVWENHIPMIHVDDLAAAVYKLGAHYDILEDRYLFAVDRGALTVRQILQAVHSRLGSGGPSAVHLRPPNGVNEALMVDYLDATLPPPSTIEELRARYDNSSVVASSLHAFLLSDMRAEPSAIFAALPEEQWTAIDGLAERIDTVVDEFTQAHRCTPCRVLVAGPPLSGADTVAAALAEQYGVPLLTIDGVTAAYEAHVAALRAELVELLGRRVARRWSRAHMRRARAEAAERAEAARQRAEEAEAAAAARAGKSEADGDGDEGEDADAVGGDEGEDGASGDSANASDDAASEVDAASVSALTVVFPEDVVRPRQRIAELLTEQRVQGFTEDGDDLLAPGAPALDVGGEDEDDDEQMMAQADDEAAEEEAAHEEAGDAGAGRAHRRALAAIRAADVAERIRIRELRLEYRLALKALSMKLANGALPRPKPEAEEDEEAEEGEDEEFEMDSTRAGAGAGGGAGGGELARDGAGEGSEGEAEPAEEGGDGAGEGEGLAEDGGDDEVGEEGEEAEESASESSEDSSIAAAAASSRSAPPPLPPHAQTTEYLDEAKSFFMRWRLRQADCRTRGYVLHGFPATVRQACLLFLAADEAGEEGGGRGADGVPPVVAARTLAPTTPEEVPPPVDATFPFADLAAMTEEQLVSLEKDIRLDRVGIVDARAEGVLAPVEEALFPDHVVVLDDSDEALIALAAATADAARRRAAAELPSTTTTTAATATSASTSAAPSPAVAVTVTDGQEEGGAAVAVAALATERRRAAEAAADARLPTGDAFYRALQAYRRHHQRPSAAVAAAAPTSPTAAACSPRDSLLTWLQSVQTRERVGATVEPVLVHPPQPPSTGSEEPPAGEEGVGSGDPRYAPPGSARSATVHMLPCPPRDAATLRAEAVAVRMRGVSTAVGLTAWPPVAALARPVTGGSPAARSSPPAMPLVSAGFSQRAEPMQWLADKLMRTLLPPPVVEARGLVAGLQPRTPLEAALLGGTRPRTRGATASETGSAATASLGGTGVSGLRGWGGPLSHMAGVNEDGDDVVAGDSLAGESALLAQLRESEAGVRAAMEQQDVAALRAERAALRQAQLREECLGVWAVAGLPKETYLMKYVLPALTPAMQEVVRLRPEDPVTVLADLLYSYEGATVEV